MTYKYRTRAELEKLLDLSLSACKLSGSPSRRSPMLYFAYEVTMEAKNLLGQLNRAEAELRKHTDATKEQEEQ